MAETGTQKTQTDASANPLDQAWELINAEGGAPTDNYSRAFNDGIGKALEVIEKLGGMNPDVRNASPGVQRAYWAFRSKCAVLDAEKERV